MAIGQFVVGGIEVGDAVATKDNPKDWVDFSWRDTLLAQYTNTLRLQPIVKAFSDAFNVIGNVEAFYNNVYNIETCGTFGLNIWGRIVGVSRLLNLPITEDFFGFQKSGNPFNQSPFYNGQALRGNYYVNNTVYRRLIKAKALLNLWDGTTYEQNKIINLIFSGYKGNIYVREEKSPDKSIISFPTKPTIIDESIVYQSGCVPVAMGVTLETEYRNNG